MYSIFINKYELANVCELKRYELKYIYYISYINSKYLNSYYGILIYIMGGKKLSVEYKMNLSFQILYYNIV